MSDYQKIEYTHETFVQTLEHYKDRLTIQQSKTLFGQSKSGNVKGAFKGLVNILSREEKT